MSQTYLPVSLDMRSNLKRLSVFFLFTLLLSQAWGQTVVKPLYLSEPSQSLDRVDPVNTSDGTTSQVPLSFGTGGVVLDATSSFFTITGTTATFSHTTTSMSNRLLLVGISYRRNGGGDIVSSVTYGGVALTQVGTTVTNGNNAVVYLYSLVNPASGTANVVVTYNSVPSKGTVVGAATFYGVDPVTPLGTFASNTGNSTTPSVSVSSAAGEIIFDVVAGRNTGVLNPNASQTHRWAHYSGDECYGGASTKPGTASTTMDWTFASSGAWAMAAISVKPFVNSVMTLSAVKDNQINNIQQTFNAGISTSLDSYNGGGIQRRAMFQFDVSSIPSNAVITSASLQLYTYFIATANTPVKAHALLSAWDEGTANSNVGVSNWTQRLASPATNWTTAGGDYNPVAAASIVTTGTTAGTYNFDLTALAQAWVNGTIQNNGLVLLNDPGFLGVSWRSKEWTTSSQRPRLVITYTVPPSASFTQTPAMCSPLNIPAGTPINIYNYVQPVTSGNTTMISKRIAASTDDAEEEGPDGANLGPGGMYLISTDLEMTVDNEAPKSGTQKVGLRFTGLNIPPGATITNAYVSFTAVAPDNSNSNSGATNLTIMAQAADNASTFTSTFYNISSRTLTTASTTWSPTPWTAGISYNTPNLANVVQEVVNRAGWANGNSLVFVITGTGSRSAASFNGNPSTAPLLVVEYLPPASLPANPNVTAELRNGGTTFATLTNPTYNSATNLLSWTGFAGSNVTIPANASVSLQVTNNTNTSFNLLYDSQTRPSRVELSTNTYINIPTYAVHDAPYPGGNIITGAAAGQTVYVRATVTDPFGASDITGLNITINPVGTTVSATSVATVGCSRIYEYAWNTTGFSGNYTLPATAKEGYENNVTASNTLNFNICSPAIGTPVFALGASSSRCQGSATVTYTATSANAVTISYALDATSLGAGNTINSSTGAVSFVAGWTGASVITVTAQGCGGTLTATHSVTTNPSVTSPVFALGATSTRSLGANINTYSASAANNTGLTYSLDAASLAAGLTINAATGAVTYTPTWGGTSVITVTATGCGGPLTATHTVTTNPGVGNYVWIDLNGDGLMNEPASNGINGMKLYLFDVGADGDIGVGIGADDVLLDSTVTANDGFGSPGFYRFNIGNSGSYYVKFGVQSGLYVLTTQNPTPGIDGNSDADFNGNSAIFTIDVNGTGVSRVNPTIDAGYYCPSGFCSGQMCYLGTNNPQLVGANSAWVIDQQAGTVRIRTTLAKTFVDNTYGTNVIGWAGGHTFSNLTGSDYLQLALFNGAGTKVLEFKMDYLTASAAVPSGFKSLGVTGGDGGMLVGSAANVLDVVTSLDANFNQYGYVLTTNSPATSATYTQNLDYPNWIYDVWYEVTVSLAAFGPSGFNSVGISGVHASPSKTGNNSEPVSPAPCPCYQPAASVVSNSPVACDGNINLSLTTSAVSYIWTGPAGFSSTAQNPVIPHSDASKAGLYTATVTGANGCTAVASTSVVVGCIETGERCFVGTNNPNKVGAQATWTINPVAGTVKIRVTLANSFVDNTYGTNAVGWPSGHTFSNLTGSDFLQIALFDASNSKRLEFKMDYLTASAGAPSGYRSLGVSGGDGGMVQGNANRVLGVLTSLDANFNQYGYVLTTNSPSTNAGYAPNPTYPNWIYEVWYEVTVDLQAFGGQGFGTVGITGVHASPSKTGNNTEPVGPQPCPCVAPSAIVSSNSMVSCGSQIELSLVTDGVSYSWTGPNGFTSTQQNPIIPNASFIHNGTYTVTVTGANGCTATVSTVVTIDCEGYGAICYIGTNNPGAVSAQSKWVTTWQTNPTTGTVKIRTTLAKTFVDNTYGTNAIGWASGHTYSQLTGSDHLQIALYDGNNAKKMEFKMDYLTASAAAPSGFKSLGVLGGDGDMIVGDANDVLDVLTSLDVNFNQYGYVLTTNSPATNASYTPNPTYPNWIYDVWYEVTVKLSVFGTPGFGTVGITGVHASPSKTGNNTEPVTPTVCTISLYTAKVDVKCFGGNTGFIDLSVVGGVAPFTYSWSNGATTEDLYNLPAGTYNVTVTDAAGITASTSATITQPTLAVDATVGALVNAACFGTASGTATVNVVGGTPPYTFNWSTVPAQYTQTAINLTAGTYTVMVKDVNNCPDSVTLTLSQPPLLSSSVTSQNIPCLGANTGTAAVTAVTGGTPPYSYTWSTVPPQYTASIANLFAGTYNVTVKDAKNCTNTHTVTITEPVNAPPCGPVNIIKQK